MCIRLDTHSACHNVTAGQTDGQTKLLDRVISILTCNENGDTVRPKLIGLH